MDDRTTFKVLISIDAHIGVTSIYGLYEVYEMLKDGAKTRGYVLQTSNPDIPEKDPLKHDTLYILTHRSELENAKM